MLTLLHREEDPLVLDTSDGPITVLVTMAKDSKAKLSIDAPREVVILRDELASEN